MSAQTAAEEHHPLTNVKGTEVPDGQNDNSGGKVRDFRKLAICSIICGLSCIGIVALINSVKATREKDPEKAQIFSQKAKSFGIISIVLWLFILLLTPLLLILVSYLLTLVE
ncbi:hypothetical protein UPYG_G00105780 [Umbra pygmaea]|uniref:Transmembrane protein 265 n=1 Tax=Umbra pygmaea TaxID=75934 RepID=A0ABD0X280_UMBPY